MTEPARPTPSLAAQVFDGPWPKIVLALIFGGFLAWALVAISLARTEVADALAKAQDSRRAAQQDRESLREAVNAAVDDRGRIYERIGGLEARLDELEKARRP